MRDRVSYTGAVVSYTGAVGPCADSSGRSLVAGDCSRGPQLASQKSAEILQCFGSVKVCQCR